MSFVHEDPDFSDLIQIVARDRGLSRGLVEKDYWVTHALWALDQAGFEVWFKGGTSLSKGFALIHRFSEDLDVQIEAGVVTGLPTVSSWKSEGKRATAQRRAYFDGVTASYSVPGADVVLEVDLTDKTWRGANVRVIYPGKNLGDLAGVVAPFVRVEMGRARVTPFILRDLTSFVHEKLEQSGQLGDFDDNRPRRVRCLHPLVTLLEKLDALHRRFPKDTVEPATFVRHFEDAAHVIEGGERLPPVGDYPDVIALANEMLCQKQLSACPDPMDPAFTPTDEPRWHAIHRAHAAIDPMFWGPRIELGDACAIIREWLTQAFG